MFGKKLEAFTYDWKSVDIEEMDATFSKDYSWWGTREDISNCRNRMPTGYMWHYLEETVPYGSDKWYWYCGIFRHGVLQCGVIMDKIVRSPKTIRAVGEESGELLFEREGDRIIFCGEHQNGLRHGFGTQFLYRNGNIHDLQRGLWQNGVLTHVIIDRAMVEKELVDGAY